MWTIKAVDRAESADDADDVVTRLDALLTDGALTISGASQLYLRRESDLPSYSEIVDGIRYIHVAPSSASSIPPSGAVMFLAHPSHRGAASPNPRTR